MSSGQSSAGRKANGILQIATGSASNEAGRQAKGKAVMESVKATVRRLPPGLREYEFIAILGESWQVGKGKVDWMSYDEGKTSATKPPKPSTVHLHLISKDDLQALQEHVRSATWEDAQETWGDPGLLGPPFAERSIYQKVPGMKKRADSKQGTIDQDPDFMAFLAQLANPDTASKATVGSGGDSTGDFGGSDSDDTLLKKPITTPLVEFLKEKKAKAAAEKAAAKNAKHARQESKGKAPASSSSSAAAAASASAVAAEDAVSSLKRKGKDKDKAKPKETVKILTKRAAAAESAAEAANAVTSQLKASMTASSQSSAASDAREAPVKNRRAGIAAIARQLQRDLGLSPGVAHRKARQEAARVDAESRASASRDPVTSDVVSTNDPETSKEPEATPSAQPSASPAPKSQTSTTSRRSRGGRKQGGMSETSEGRQEVSKMTESPASAAPKTPVVLLKKRDEPQKKASPASDASTPQPSNTPTGPVASSVSSTTPASTPPAGPKAAKASARQASTSASQKKAGAGTSVTPGAMRGFVKHANPSQGVTEMLLKEAMQAFGSVTFVEIDKRKGFAYVDFAEHESLVKAIGASPIPVAQAAVQVLERKETQPAAKRVAVAASGSSPSASRSSAATTAPAAADASATMPPATPTGPSADRGQANGPSAKGEEKEKRSGRRRGRGRGAGGGGDLSNKEGTTSAAAATPGGAGNAVASSSNVSTG